MFRHNQQINLLTILLCLLVLVAMGLVCIIYIGNHELSYFINGMHSPFLDFLMKYVTHLGDGIFASALAIYWMLKKQKKQGIYLLIAYGLSSVITQSLKRTVFSDMHRPLKHLILDKVHLVEGVAINYNNSFPSGHSTTIFAVSVAFSLLINRPIFSILFLIVATLVACSRVYLLQHFVTDIIAGAAIGSVCAIIVFIFMRKSLEHSELS
jgi:membrane-associated phospholipid phosphatase